MSDNYLISAKEHYLSIEVVDAFAHYLADFLSTRAFASPYLTENLRPKTHYCFVSIQDAYEQFMMEPKNVELETRADQFREPIREALLARDDEKLNELINALYEERLQKRNNEWLLGIDLTVSDLIGYGYEQFKSESPEYHLFGIKHGPRMTSNLSRIYSLLIDDFLTYESRVVATLCYFVREFCLEKGIKLPAELQFYRLQGWGKDKKVNERNASWGDNIFPSLDAVKKQPKRESEFAKSNSLASWVCSRAIEIALQRPEAQWLAGDRPLRKLQSAFFMMGARLPSYRESDQSQAD